MQRRPIRSSEAESLGRFTPTRAAVPAFAGQQTGLPDAQLCRSRAAVGRRGDPRQRPLPSTRRSLGRRRNPASLRGAARGGRSGWRKLCGLARTKKRRSDSGARRSPDRDRCVRRAPVGIALQLSRSGRELPQQAAPARSSARRGVACSGFFLLRAGGAARFGGAPRDIPLRGEAAAAIGEPRRDSGQRSRRIHCRGRAHRAAAFVRRASSHARRRSRSPARGALYSRRRSCRWKACSKQGVCAFWLFSTSPTRSKALTSRSRFTSRRRAFRRRRRSESRAARRIRCGRWA